MMNQHADNWMPPPGLETMDRSDCVDPAEKYREALRNIPASGGGGCHVALLSIANLGRAAGISPEQIARDLAEHVHGSRRVTGREIQDAVAKAFATQFKPRERRKINAPRVLDFILKRGSGFTKADLFEASPVRIDWPVNRDGIEVLRWLYQPDDRLFIGGKFDAAPEYVQPVSEWLRRFECGQIPEHIVPNPLSGKSSLTKDGRQSFRADACIEQFRFAVLEFDSMPLELQVCFWAGVALPIVALIDSGGKSIHAWVQIDAQDATDWTTRVEEELFDILTPLGIDATCKNESRLSRMPGHLRDGKRPQRLLFFSPEEGRTVLPWP